MGYPLFQKALKDSTPFSGTMADTSTPTPTGQEPQVEPGPPQVPQPTELPGRAGDQERLLKIQQDRALIQQQAQTLANSTVVRTNPWSLAVHLALNGTHTIGKESAGDMYPRLAAINRLMMTDAQLAQEERLIAHPDPHTQAAIDKGADRERRAADMNFLDRYYKDVLKQPNPIPQENQILFIETGYGLVSGVNRPGEEDEIKNMKGIADLSQEVGPEGVGALGLVGRASAVATAAAKHGDKIRQEKADEKAKGDVQDVLGQFEKPSQLFSAMMQDYRETVKGEPYSIFEDYEAPDPIVPGNTITRQRRVPPDKDLQRQARAEVATRWPGYEKYFPNFVEKGFTDVPAPVVEPKQGDVQTRRQQLKERLAKEK